MNVESFQLFKKSPTQAALIGLLEDCKDSVYNVSYQVLKEHHDAEDATQEVLIKIIEQTNQLKDIRSFKGWLYRVSFNKALEIKQKERTRKTYEKETQMDKDKDKDQKDVSEVSLGAADHIQEHIGLLNDDMRCLIVEHFFERRTLESLSKERSCSTAAIWKKIEKAKESLRRSLSKAGLAGLIPFIDPVIKSISFASAPAGIITKSMIAQSLAVTGQTAVHAITIGSLTFKIKTAVATAILISVSTITYVGYQQFKGTNSVIEEHVVNIKQPVKKFTPLKNKTEPKGNTNLNSSNESNSNSRLPKKNLKSPSLAKNKKTTTKKRKFKYDLSKTLPASLKKFNSKFQQIVRIKNKEIRWEKLRELGIFLTDKEFEAAEKNVKEIKPSVMSKYYFQQWMKLHPSVNQKWHISNYSPDGVGSLSLGIAGFNGPEGELLALIIYHWAKKKPQEVLEWCKSVSYNNDSLPVFNSLAISLAATNIKKAIAIVNSYPKGENKDVLLAKIAEEWATVDPKAAITWSEKVSVGTVSYNAQRLILTEWAKADPKAAGTWVLDTSVESIHRTALNEIIDQWSLKNPKEAADWLESLPSKFDKNHLSKKLAINWAEKELDTLLMWADDNKESNRRHLILKQAAIFLAKNDPVRAIEIAEELPKGVFRNRTISKIAYQQTLKSFKEGFEFCLSISESGTRNESLKHISYSVRKNWKEALALVNTLPATPVKFKMISIMISHITRQNQDEAMRLIQTFPKGELRDKTIQIVAIYFKDRKEGLKFLKENYSTLTTFKIKKAVIHSIGMWWSNEDPESASKWVVTIPEEIRKKAVEVIANRWASKDVEKSLLWASRLEKMDKELAIIGITEHLSSNGKNPKRAAQLLKDLAPSNKRDDQIDQVYRDWSGNDPRTAANGATQLTENQGRDNAIYAVVNKWAISDHRKALIWANELSENEGQSSALGGIAAYLAGLKLQDAVSLAESLPEGFGRQKAFDKIAWQWSFRSLTKMENWMKKIKPGKSRDIVINIFVAIAGEKDPALAAPWVNLIEDPEIKMKTIGNYAWKLLRKNQKKGIQYIKNSNLPKDKKDALLAHIK